MRNLKKVLALVLALAMSMSLVTIANAADFSDKADINYKEAVDVMTAIGVLEGFEDGSFKPGETLTREQAAKIICTMLLGENADKLGTTSSSFKDVASTRWSAPYIEYCAALGIVAGNGDGTFNPTGKLTGYAFAKMLLTALGYDAEIEGFVGAGWNLKVAAMASRSGILSDISDFIGTGAVTREQAAQMALSTLKAIQVEYVGNSVEVSGSDINVSVGNNRFSYVENLNTTDGNIKDDNYMQFAEQRFPNLKLTTTAGTEDDFGRPANSWSLANVTIGNYGKTPSFTYTSSMVSGSDNDATKVSKLGLKGYKLAADTTGSTVYAYTNGSSNGVKLNSVAAIGDLTANGTVVEVYTSATNADTITDVVVIKTQLMVVDRVKSDSVTLAQVKDADGNYTGVKVNSVKEDEEGFAALSSMKADDYVLVVPVKASGETTYSVASVSVPQTATGNISKVTVNGSGATTGIALDGTEYKMSAQWASDDTLNTSSVNKNVTSTAYLDNYGYAIYVKDVKASTNYILFTGIYNSLVDGKLIKMAEGYDMNGEKLSLNVGTASISAKAGEVWTYTTTTRNSADYKLDSKVAETSSTVTISAGDAKLDGHYYSSDVKFLYPVKNSDGDIISVTVKDGVQKVEVATKVQYITNNDGNVTYVILPNDNEIEVGTDVIYISAITGSTTDADGRKVSVFTAYIDGEKVENCVATKELSNKGFYTYAENDGIYTVKEYNTTSGKATSVMVDAVMSRSSIKNNTYVTVNGKTDLNAGNAVVVDLSGGNNNFASVKDLADATQYSNYKVSIVYNDSASSNEKGKVSYIFVLDHDVSTVADLQAQPSSVSDLDSSSYTTFTNLNKFVTVGLSQSSVGTEISLSGKMASLKNTSDDATLQAALKQYSNDEVGASKAAFIAHYGLGTDDFGFVTVTANGQAQYILVKGNGDSVVFANGGGTEKSVSFSGASYTIDISGLAW